MDSFERHWKLALAISCETIGFIGFFLTLILHGTPGFYLEPMIGGILSICSLLLFLFGLGMLVLPLFRQRRNTKFEPFYEDRVRSNDKDDY